MEKNENLTNDLIIFDAHCDTVYVLRDNLEYFISKDKSHISINKIKKGGLKAQIFAVYVNPAYSPNSAVNKAMQLYNVLEKKLFNLNSVKKVTSTDEMDLALKNHKLACWLSLEGGHIIENSIENLEHFYSLGFRSMTLTHSKNNDWADSSGEEPKWDGLNKLGKKIINRMEEIGMAIDVSHVSDKTVDDVLETSSAPIMVSHSCAKSLCGISRNIPDNLIKEIAERKGFIGVNFFPGFLDNNIYSQVMKKIKKYQVFFEKKIKGHENDPEFIDKAEKEIYLRKINVKNNINLNTLIDHIVYISKIGGIDCVGLGSDFDGIPFTPTDLKDVSEYPSLVTGLSDRGFTDSEIQKIMGLNLYNFFKNFNKK